MNNDILMWCLPPIEEIEKDENIVFEGEHGYLYLKDNPEAKIYVHEWDTSQDIEEAGNDVMELYRYFFRVYGIFFYSVSYVHEFVGERLFHNEKNAAMWMGITQYMMDLGGWTEEDAIEIIKQREEWLPIYAFYEDYNYRTFIINFYEEISKPYNKFDFLGWSEIEKDLYDDVITYLDEDAPYLITEDVMIPEGFISSLNHMCETIKRGVEDGTIKVLDGNEESTDENNDEFPF